MSYRDDEARNLPAAGSRPSRHWRDEAARLIAVEVERIRRGGNMPMTRETLDVAERLAGHVLVAVSSLP
ncbi:hypothetical protein [Mesorhizobium loti]|uniref:hypothetical protein n=1 Tax=Rhizobium loti TaxID=381 RepID=UPI003D7C25BD